jgi:adenylate cyclase
LALEVSVDDVARWHEAGLYDPGDPAAGDRLALLEYLSARGATIEQMVDAHRRGSLPGVAADLVMADAPTATVTEIAARSELSPPLVLRVLLAAGIPAEADTEVPVHVEGLLQAFKRGADIMGEEAILAFTRVLGAAATNVAESAIGLFFAELGPGSVREGADELSRARLAAAATHAFTEVPDVLALMVVDAFERAQLRAEEARRWSVGTAAEGGGPTEMVALGFVDLVGSTRWAQQLELREQNLALTRFESAAWTGAVVNGGRVVKTIGDEVFFAASTADAACRIATEVLQAVAEDGVLPPARGAVGLGPAISREGDYFGPLVNLLARLVKAGAPGELVVTASAAKELEPDSWAVEPMDVAELRGIEGPVHAFAVTRLGGG